MTAGKSDYKKNNATSTVFKTRDGENDAIRVGYIDKRRGYISGLSVYEGKISMQKIILAPNSSLQPEIK